MRAVVALGGNALSPPTGAGGVEEIRSALDVVAGPLADLVARGDSLVLTHGNGPQVGRILLQQQAAAAVVPPMPMDVCGAESVGQLGYLLAQSIDSALAARGLATRALCVLTRVVVDPADPAFHRPTKPVGPAYDEAEARRLAATTDHAFVAMPDGRWRRVVPSPRPVRIVEEDALVELCGRADVVIAAGGGGVPVVDDDGRLHGVDAVIDKDLTAARLAWLCAADVLLLLSDVAAVMRGFGTPDATAITRLTTREARELHHAGAFPAGSMGPKVEAACEFVEATGARAVITDLGSLLAAVDGVAGTQVVP
ncbi:MAG: carbamate kinase [Frankia sp.]|nr:carbamate kinase [Frankia sp.]